MINAVFLMTLLVGSYLPVVGRSVYRITFNSLKMCGYCTEDARLAVSTFEPQTSSLLSYSDVS